MNIVIVYGTTEGQTRTIAERLADGLRAHGFVVDVDDARTARPAFTAYDAVIVGASVHMGKHDKQVVRRVRENRTTLESLPSAFFSVSLAAHGDDGEAQRYVEEFQKETGWRPARVATFAGALRYTAYGFVKRHLMRRIAHTKPGDLGVDFSRDYDYTDWDAVDRFAEEVAAELASRAG